MTLAKPLTSYLNRNLWNRVRGRLSAQLRKSTKDDFADQKYLFREIPVKTIFDVGANIGFVATLYHQNFREAHIYCFEPNPKVFKVLMEKGEKNPKIHAYPYAVSNQDTELTFLLNKKSGSSSLFRPTETNCKRFYLSEPAPITVQSVTIDSFCHQENIQEIDILKLDIEGAEIMALEGAKQMLKDGKIKAIYSEVAVIAMYEHHQLFHHIASFLEQFDYHLYNLYDFGESSVRQAFFGNAIFIGSRMRHTLESIWGEAACGW